jgi:hypothetical protein
MIKKKIVILLLLLFSIENIYAVDKLSGLGEGQTLKIKDKNGNVIQSYEDKYSNYNFTTSKNCQDYGHNNPRTVCDISYQFNANLDLGLGDPILPGAAKKINEKLDKIFDPLIEEIEEIKQKNMEELNSDNLYNKGDGQKINKGFLRIIGLDEEKLKEIYKIVGCPVNITDTGGNNYKNLALCSKPNHYNAIEISFLASIREGIEKAAEKVKDKWKEKGLKKINKQIANFERQEKATKARISKALTGSEEINIFETNTFNSSSYYQKNIDEYCKSNFSSNDTDLQNKINNKCGSKENLNEKSRCENKIRANANLKSNACKSGFSGSKSNYAKLTYDYIQNFQGIEGNYVPVKLQYESQKAFKNVNACELLEKLESDDPKERMEIDRIMEEKKEALKEGIETQVMSIALTSLVKMLPEYFTMQHALNAMQCAITANMATSKEIKVELSEGEQKDILDAEEGMSTAIGEIMNEGAEMMGFTQSVKGTSKIYKEVKHCISKELKESGDKREIVFDIRVDSTGIVIPITPVTPSGFYANMPSSLGLSASGQTNLTKQDTKTRLKDCITTARSKAFSSIYKECIDEGQKLKLDLSFSLMPEIAKFSKIKRDEKKIQCILDQKMIEEEKVTVDDKPIKIDFNKWITTAASYLKDMNKDKNKLMYTNMIRAEGETYDLQGEIPNMEFVQILMKKTKLYKDISKIPYKNTKMYKFYNKELKKLLSEKSKGYFNDSICFLSYDPETNQTLIPYTNKQYNFYVSSSLNFFGSKMINSVQNYFGKKEVCLPRLRQTQESEKCRIKNITKSRKYKNRAGIEKTVFERNPGIIMNRAGNTMKIFGDTLECPKTKGSTEYIEEKEPVFQEGLHVFCGNIADSIIKNYSTLMKLSSKHYLKENQAISCKPTEQNKDTCQKASWITTKQGLTQLDFDDTNNPINAWRRILGIFNACEILLNDRTELKPPKEESEYEFDNMGKEELYFFSWLLKEDYATREEVRNEIYYKNMYDKVWQEKLALINKNTTIKNSQLIECMQVKEQESLIYDSQYKKCKTLKIQEAEKIEKSAKTDKRKDLIFRFQDGKTSEYLLENIEQEIKRYDSLLGF